MLFLRRHGAPEHGGRGAAAKAIAAMWALVIVETQKAIERSLQLPQAGEVVAPEGDPLVLMEQRPLQAFYEPVGPRMPRLGPGVPDLAGRTGGDDARFKLLAVVGQDPAQGPARAR